MQAQFSCTANSGIAKEESAAPTSTTVKNSGCAATRTICRRHTAVITAHAKITANEMPNIARTTELVRSTVSTSGWGSTPTLTAEPVTFRVGDLVGLMLGAVLGAKLGAVLGAELGAVLGAKLGDVLGILVGFGVVGEPAGEYSISRYGAEFLPPTLPFRTEYSVLCIETSSCT